MKFLWVNFFDLLEGLTDRYKFQAFDIYNVDEVGITTVPKTLSKIIALKGRRQVGTLISGKIGQLVTIDLCMSAAGHYIPPLLMFPRVTIKKTSNWRSTWNNCSMPTKWMDANIYVCPVARTIYYSCKT